MSNAEAVAISALREAVRAVSIGEDVAAAAVPDERAEPEVTLEVARLLEAVARLMRSTDLDAVPRSGSNHRLHAVVQHLDAGAQLARRASEQEPGGDRDVDAVAGLSRGRRSAEGDADRAGGADAPSLPETRRSTDAP